MTAAGVFLIAVAAFIAGLDLLERRRLARGVWLCPRCGHLLLGTRLDDARNHLKECTHANV